MEEKRKEFPRFYFLSDDELLKILSTATDIKDTEKHISKVFEFINKLEYSHPSTVSHIISFEGEKVKVKKVVWRKDSNIEDNMKMF